MHLMSEPHERLRQARRAAGYEEATDAARALGLREPTYLAHENGSRGFRARAPEYAKRYGVSLEWLLTGRGQKEQRQILPADRTVPLVGYVGAGAEAHFSASGELDRVAAPEGSTEDTVAVEIRGESLGSFFDRWLIFYDQVRRPVTADLVGKLCVVGLEDGRILVKKIQRSRSRGLFHLISQTEGPILDVAIEWAARVKNMVPR
jgi:DNA-binding XRE family transcriptional regulator